MPLTVADVEAAVTAIGKLGHLDNEAAGEDERALHKRVFAAIVDGHADSAALAMAALKTFGMPFHRW